MDIPRRKEVMYGNSAPHDEKYYPTCTYPSAAPALNKTLSFWNRTTVTLFTAEVLGVAFLFVLDDFISVPPIQFESESIFSNLKYNLNSP